MLKVGNISNKKRLKMNKDLITSIIAFLLVVLEPVETYLMNNEFEWQTFGVTVLAAIVAYFTGKGKDGKKIE
jgi:hypothetical protein